MNKEFIKLIKKDLKLENGLHSEIDFSKGNFAIYLDQVILNEQSEETIFGLKIKLFLLCYFAILKNSAHMVCTTLEDILSVAGISSSTLKSGGYKKSSIYYGIVEIFDDQVMRKHITGVDKSLEDYNPKDALAFMINSSEFYSTFQQNDKGNRPFVRLGLAELFTILNKKCQPKKKLNLLYLYVVIKSKCYSFCNGQYYKAAWISTTYLENYTGVTRKTLNSLIDELINDGLIIREIKSSKNKNDNGFNKKSYYSYISNPTARQDIFTVMEYNKESCNVSPTDSEINPASNIKVEIDDFDIDYLLNTMDKIEASQPIQSINGMMDDFDYAYAEERAEALSRGEYDYDYTPYDEEYF